MTDEPMAVPATDSPTPQDAAADDGGAGGLPVDLGPEDASLLALVDRLGSLLDRSDLSEIAVEAGATRLVLRKPSALSAVVAAAAAPTADGAMGAVPGVTPGSAPASAGGPSAALRGSSAPSPPSRVAGSVVRMIRPASPSMYE